MNGQAADNSLPRILITTGEPAGIGPDITLQSATASLPGRIIAIGDRALLTARAKLLGLKVKVVDDDDDQSHQPHQPGVLAVIHHPCKSPVVPGESNPENSEYVVGCIDRAVDLCLAGRFDAMVTAPVNKAIINRAGIEFSGHTEWIAERCHAPSPVMMLASGDLRVCLLTTHIPLAEVASRVTKSRIQEVVGVILGDLRRRFNIQKPVIGVCGLNPHAGEGGYLGREEIEIITPALDELRATGADVVGPIPADTAFTPARLASLDAVLAMYHDQGLPVSKHANFGETVNITLGLPIVRTSVDHGTALELAATGTADESSLKAAITLACQLAGKSTIR